MHDELDDYDGPWMDIAITINAVMNVNNERLNQSPQSACSLLRVVTN